MKCELGLAFQRRLRISQDGREWCSFPPFVAAVATPQPRPQEVSEILAGRPMQCLNPHSLHRVHQECRIPTPFLVALLICSEVKLQERISLLENTEVRTPWEPLFLLWESRRVCPCMRGCGVEERNSLGRGWAAAGGGTGYGAAPGHLSLPLCCLILFHSVEGLPLQASGSRCEGEQMATTWVHSELGIPKSK